MYYSNSKDYDFNFDNMVDWQFAKQDNFYQSSEIKYLVGDGFRLYLNDLAGYTNSTSNFEMISKLKKLELNVHDFKSNTDTTQKLNILTDNSIQTDSDGRQYLDILFDEYMPYMKIANGDYLISIMSVLEDDFYSKKFDFISDSTYRKLFHTVTLYSSIDFFRFQVTNGINTRNIN